MKPVWLQGPGPLPASVIPATTRQWATLLRAGVSLAPALQMLVRSASMPELSKLLQEVLTDVESGQPLSQALARHPAHFSALYVGMVQAGESAGILDTMMDRLAHTLERNEALRRRVRSALTYPMVVIVIALSVLALILLHVVPVFEEVFASFGASLPLATRWVLMTSRALSEAWPWIVLGALALTLWLRQQWQDPLRQRQWSRILLSTPGLGGLLQASVVARWSLTLSALLEAGLPLTEALPTASQASGHPVYQRIGEHLQRRVAQGGRLSEGLAHTGRFPPMLVQLCACGEDTGTLSPLLERAGQMLEQEVQDRVNALSSLLEPLIIVTLGGAIGCILVAMYLPIFRLGQVF